MGIKKWFEKTAKEKMRANNNGSCSLSRILQLII